MGKPQMLEMHQITIGEAEKKNQVLPREDAEVQSAVFMGVPVDACHM